MYLGRHFCKKKITIRYSTSYEPASADKCDCLLKWYALTNVDQDGKHGALQILFGAGV